MHSAPEAVHPEVGGGGVGVGGVGVGAVGAVGGVGPLVSGQSANQHLSPLLTFPQLTDPFV